MATGGEENPTESKAAFDEFLTEVKKIEKRDSVLTSTQQIDRLLRPGSKYANLNPYDVLMIEPDLSPEELRKAYRKLSFLVHPDKNNDARERAQDAFEAVNKAYKMLEDPEQLEYCQLIWEEAKATIDKMLKEKRKKAKANGSTDQIDEDNPLKYKQLIRNTMSKLFADYHIKKQHLEERESNERKRQKELEDEEKEKIKKSKEMKEKWEETRVDRVASWRDFQNKGSKKKTKRIMSSGLKLPKHRQEKRT